MANGVPWPAWARYTATGAMAAGGVLVALTLTFGDVRRDSADARKSVDAHEMRITALESERVGIGVVKERVEAQGRALEKIDSKLNELLQRVPVK